jgi:MFS family permease
MRWPSSRSPGSYWRRPAALPLILSGFFGGTIVDRLGHKRASVIADLASLIAVALIPLLHGLGLLNFGLLLALVFLGALLDAPGATARAALVPELIALGKLRPERANTAHEVIESGAQFAGPILAGLLIAALGPATVLWFDAATFLISALLVTLAVPTVQIDADEQAGNGYLADLTVGVRFVLHDPPIRAIFVSATVISFLFSPLFGVVLPYYIKTTYESATGLGLIIGAFGGGGVLGALIYAAGAHRLPRRKTFVGGVFAICGGFIALTTLPSLPVMIAAFFLAGLLSGPNGPLIPTILQERTPPALRGRVFGATTAIGYAGAPLGVLVAGALLQTIGVQPVLIGMAVIFSAVALALVYDRGLYLLDTGITKVEAEAGEEEQQQATGR